MLNVRLNRQGMNGSQYNVLISDKTMVSVCVCVEG